MSDVAIAKECLEAWHNYKPTENDWSLYVAGVEQPVGHIKSAIAEAIDWPTEFEKNAEAKKVSVKDQVEGIETDTNDAFVKLYEKNKGRKYFAQTYDSWKATGAKERDYHPIFVPGNKADNQKAGLEVPSPMRGILGILTAGIHVNVYTTKADGKVDKIWVSKRAGKSYNGCFDQIIAGGMELRHQLDPWVTMAQETKEESKYKVEGNKLISRVVADGIVKEDKEVGTVHLKSLIWFFTDKTGDRTADSEKDHIEPGVRFCFDVEVQDEEIPEYNPKDQSSSGFQALSVEDIKGELKKQSWKPNCGLVMLDFLRRKELLSEDEKREVEQLDDPRFELPIPEPFQRWNVQFDE